MSAGMTRLLSVERLSKSFGGLQAVADLSFDVEEGEILGIIGPNGAGKTTAVNLDLRRHQADQRAGRAWRHATSRARRPHVLVAERPGAHLPGHDGYAGQTVRENLLRGAFREIYPGLLATLLGTAARARRAPAPSSTSTR